LLIEGAGDPSSLLPNSEEDLIKVNILVEKQPLIVFERMRELMAELTFLTDIIDDKHFEDN
jgi:hypothetical protein